MTEEFKKREKPETVRAWRQDENGDRISLTSNRNIYFMDNKIGRMTKIAINNDLLDYMALNKEIGEINLREFINTKNSKIKNCVVSNI